MNLVTLPCRWRGEVRLDERFICTSPKLVMLVASIDASTCRKCYCRDHEPAAAPAPAATAILPREKRRGPCSHQGALRDERVCTTCQGTVRIKVFDCPLHGECTLSKAIGEVACCVSCEDFKPRRGDGEDGSLLAQ